MSCVEKIRELRRTWVPLIRIALASIADLVADWYFYDEVNKSEDLATKKYDLYLFIFFIVSACMGGLTLVSILITGCRKRETRFVQRLNQVLAFEILLEDIPQFVLTSMVTADLGLMTPTAAFNIATSVFNFVFNILEMLDVAADEEGQVAPPAAQSAAPTNRSSAYAVTGTDDVQEA
mmetsp:Transcript_21949/g.52241  ORF Transcript_21949/g.52241 Transcript_21949/m.52241 type:complete len:178 (+) Transcript_21949:190-723(+)|eukprot:CAMPEP_0197185496 /NCGR_PEP_ID=MMETSP1423-20130617/12072_1 /TAXON_ID=476441 /ORGANISM="Pseudo-nitzschia heimii, Strain UNC1101" /LENGTH=177 /DNA_ID=CAMNT_0042636577 /DNA_START=96 /DNA_END=629 /DNA_ORIENTATION=-